MLGSYFNARGRIPFIHLSVPNGENVFGEYARSVLNGRYDASQPLRRFKALGHVSTPDDGAYLLEASRGHEDVKLNDLGYSLGSPVPGNRYGAEIQLTKGVYDVTFSVGNNGGQLAEAAFRIVAREFGQELPIFAYESELREFLADPSFGEETFKTSKWTREENELK